jgi:hypothetical protein
MFVVEVVPRMRRFHSLGRIWWDSLRMLVQIRKE